MVRLLSSKKKDFLEPIDDPCKAVVKKFKQRRISILKQSLKKLKKIPDAEQCLRQAVLIRNTFIKAKDLSPKVFERQLITQNAENADQTDILTQTLNNRTCMEEDDQEMDDSTNILTESSETTNYDCSQTALV